MVLLGLRAFIRFVYGASVAIVAFMTGVFTEVKKGEIEKVACSLDEKREKFS